MNRFIVSCGNDNTLIHSKKQLYNFIKMIPDNKSFEIYEIIQVEPIYCTGQGKLDNFINKNAFCNITDCENYCDEQCCISLDKLVTPNTKECKKYDYDELPF